MSYNAIPSILLYIYIKLILLMFSYYLDNMTFCVPQTCHTKEGEQIKVIDIWDEVPETTICKYFGLKAMKPGRRYNIVTIVDKQAAILVSLLLCV